MSKISDKQRAEALFKAPAAKPPSERDQEKKSFDDNRERLKAERLAREADAPPPKRKR